MHRLVARLATRVVAVLTASVLLAAGTIVSSTAADAAPRYTRMSVTESSYARAVLSTINNQRAANGLKRLRANLTLILAAGAHNRAMAAVNVISHQLRGERDFVARDRAAGWRAKCRSGENLGVNGDLSSAGAVQLQQMMYAEVAPNDGHRQNALNPRYTHVGVAVLIDNRNQRLWLTVDFAQRRC